MSRIGYARVSTTDQDLDIQITKLNNADAHAPFHTLSQRLF